jgi:hypothetical protein
MSNSDRTSDLGQNLTCRTGNRTSEISLRADVLVVRRHVSKVPNSDVASSSTEDRLNDIQKLSLCGNGRISIWGASSCSAQPLRNSMRLRSCSDECHGAASTLETIRARQCGHV